MRENASSTVRAALVAMLTLGLPQWLCAQDHANNVSRGERRFRLYDCAANALFVVSRIHGIEVDYARCQQLLPVKRGGNSMLELKDAMDAMGFEVTPLWVGVQELDGLSTSAIVALPPLVQRGTPAYLRSDNGAEFTAKAVREWLQRVGVRRLFIEPGSPWENGYIESFNGKLRDEFLNGELFDTLLEAKVLTERWRVHYNRRRPHSALGYRPPAPETVEPLPPGFATLRPSRRARAAADLT